MGNDTTSELRRAKNTAYKWGRKSWKFLAQLQAKIVRKNKRRYINDNTNKAVTSKQWWLHMKNLKKNKNATPEKYLINDNWLTADEFVNNLNTYYAQVGGEAIYCEDMHSIKHSNRLGFLSWRN